MSKLVTILMPTINPIDWLRLALDSIKNTASDYSQVEVLLRVDDDNQSRIDDLPKLVADYGIKYVIGPRYRGYHDMHQFVSDLLTKATGDWVWLFDDDAWINGKWQEQLALIPCNPLAGPIVKVEKYCLGPSEYRNDAGPVGLIIPRITAKALKIHSPVDQVWHNQLMAMNWKIHFLEGASYCHEGRAR
jgi:glycosyltransferase involved in cell wall biosynthesis